MSWLTSWSRVAPWGSSSQCELAESTIPTSPKASGWATAGSISAPSEPSTSMPGDVRGDGRAHVGRRRLAAGAEGRALEVAVDVAVGAQPAQVRPQGLGEHVERASRRTPHRLELGDEPLDRARGDGALQVVTALEVAVQPGTGHPGARGDLLGGDLGTVLGDRGARGVDELQAPRLPVPGPPPRPAVGGGRLAHGLPRVPPPTGRYQLGVTPCIRYIALHLPAAREARHDPRARTDRPGAHGRPAPGVLGPPHPRPVRSRSTGTPRSSPAAGACRRNAPRSTAPSCGTPSTSSSGSRSPSTRSRACSRSGCGSR